MENESQKNSLKRWLCICLWLLGMVALQGYGQENGTNSNGGATNKISSTSKHGDYECTDTETGKTLKLHFDSPPSQADVEKKFAEYYLNETKAKAEKGEIEAQYNLGYLYLSGKGIPLNFSSRQRVAEAVKWFRKAAEQGNAPAQCYLGLYYAHIDIDEAEAVKWFRKAAEQGEPIAQGNLGELYCMGRGVPQNYAEGVKWLRKSAEQGKADSQCDLGNVFFLGKGVPQDYVEAVKWYRKAAEQGDAAAQYFLGYIFYKGEGVPQDYVAAYKWINLAAAQGNTNAIFGRDVVAVDMTSEQIAKGQKLASEFIPRKEAPSSGSDNSASPDSPTATGTGFFITDDGYLITNNHVVKGATKVRLLTSAGLIDAKVVQVDAGNDLALLKATGRFSPLPISPSRSARLGSTVATVGFPDIGLQGFAPKLAKGEIASLAGAADDPRYFQISVPVQPGNSGGALVDAHGNVVGIVAAKLDAGVALETSGALPENVNYAVKSSFLLGFLESVPDVAAELKDPVTADLKFEDVVKSAQAAAVLVLVY
jgi:hypothetical protein